MTAPSGPEWDAAVEAGAREVGDKAWDDLYSYEQDDCRHRAKAALLSALPSLTAMIRREAVEVVRRVRLAEEKRHRDDQSDRVGYVVVAAMNAAHECGEAVEVALLPPPPGGPEKEGE